MQVNPKQCYNIPQNHQIETSSESFSAKPEGEINQGKTGVIGT